MRTANSSGMLSGISTLNNMKPELNPLVSANPNSTGTRKIWGEKLAVTLIPNMVTRCFSGVTSASRASPTASSPKDAKPKITHGIVSKMFGEIVMARSENDSIITKTISRLFLPKVSESLPQMGALNKPAIFSMEKRNEASAIWMPLPMTKYSLAKTSVPRSPSI